MHSTSLHVVIAHSFFDSLERVRTLNQDWFRELSPGRRGRGVLPIMANTGRLRPEGVPFSAFGFVKGWGFH